MVTTSNEVSVQAVNLPPVIAIHGVGNHEPDKIKDSLGEAFRRASLSADIEEFNWDKFADHSATGVRDGVQLLSTAAVSISQAAAQAHRPSRRRVDRLLFNLEENLYHGVLRLLLALGLAILIIGPLFHLLVLLPSSIFGGLSWQDFRWVKNAATVEVLAGLFVILALFAISLLRCLVTVSIRPIWVSIRRVVLLLLQPVFLLLTIPLSARFGSGLASWVGSLIPMALISSVLAIVLSPLSGSFMETISKMGVSFSVLTGIAAVAGLHILLRRLWVGALLKVILDITRYMGSSKYRTTLQAAFDSKITDMRSLGEGNRFLLFAHSLGSVIALDSIINSSVWGPDDEVQLVTLGSPINRFFIRFFPGYLFPASIRNASTAAARRLRRFSWINIHRRWDYVGTSLGLENSKIGIEICTGQLTKIFSAHSNYWEDDLVIQKFKKGLKLVTPVTTEQQTSSEAGHTMPEIYENRTQDRIARIVRSFTLILVLFVVGIAIFKFFENRHAWIQSIDQEIAGLQQHGEPELATITYHRTVESSGKEHADVVHHFVFRLVEPYGELPPVEIYDNVIYDDHARRFDYKALAKFVLEDCALAEEKKWWQIFKSRKSIPCTRTEIPIRFNAEDPSSFWLPGFAVTRTFGDVVQEVIGSLILAGFFVAACIGIAVFGAVPLFRLFLGLNARA